MNSKTKQIVTICLCICILLPVPLNGWAFTQSSIQPKPEFSSQTIKIIKALERFHYLEKKLNDALSANILDSYIQRLDPGRQLFTSQDIKQFKAHQFELDDELKKGDLGTGFDIFNTYMDRSREHLEFILSLVPTWEDGFDFTQEDTIIIDHKTREWMPDMAALKVLWTKGLKNHIIMLKLENKTSDDITQLLEKIYTNRLTRLNQNTAGDIFQFYINSVTASFDPHTQYFPPRASEDFDINMSLSLEGIGAVLQTEYEYTKVVRLIPKGPADKSNLLMPGDKIIGVGQGETGEIIDTIGQRIDHVVRQIRGPKNSYVRLKIIPAKSTSDTIRTIQIKRDQVKLEEQSAHKQVVTISHEGQSYKIGIIEIPTFYIDFNAYNQGDANYKSTTRDVKQLLAQLKQEQIDGLIIDLRNNGGGSLQEANQLTGLFLTSGPTVQVKTKRKIVRFFDEDPGIEYTGPLVVMVNRMSASASEIFAGAIMDYQRGIVVGTQSFGKGSVQELHPLDEGKLKLTSAKFYRVSGKSTQSRGVLPDIVYPHVYNLEEVGESALDGALPWDKTVKATYKAYPPLYTIVQTLDAAYQKRAEQDPGLNYLRKRIQLATQTNDQTRLSLNLDTRRKRKDHYEQQGLEIENAYRKSQGKDPVTALDHDGEHQNGYQKILMDQTHLVMADFIQLSRRLGHQW